MKAWWIKIFSAATVILTLGPLTGLAQKSDPRVDEVMAIVEQAKRQSARQISFRQKWEWARSPALAGGVGIVKGIRSQIRAASAHRLKAIEEYEKIRQRTEEIQKMMREQASPQLPSTVVQGEYGRREVRMAKMKEDMLEQVGTAKQAIEKREEFEQTRQELLDYLGQSPLGPTTQGEKETQETAGGSGSTQ